MPLCSCRFEPDYDRKIDLLRTDETESAIERPPDRLFGMVVRYVPRPPPEVVELEEEKGPNIVRKKKEPDPKDTKAKGKK